MRDILVVFMIIATVLVMTANAMTSPKAVKGRLEASKILVQGF